MLLHYMENLNKAKHESVMMTCSPWMHWASLEFAGHTNSSNVHTIPYAKHSLQKKKHIATGFEGVG